MGRNKMQTSANCITAAVGHRH